MKGASRKVPRPASEPAYGLPDMPLFGRVGESGCESIIPRQPEMREDVKKM
jgi:hypothetical protein